MTTEIYGTLRHCLMAGMCSAAEFTSTISAGNGENRESERARLNQAKWRCPYVANSSIQYIKERSNNFRRVSLHCECDWIEENS